MGQAMLRHAVAHGRNFFRYARRASWRFTCCSGASPLRPRPCIAAAEHGLLSCPADEQPLGMFPRALHRANAPASVLSDPTPRSRPPPPTTPCCPITRTCCRRRAAWLALRPRPRCSTPTSRGKQPAAAAAACARRPRENSLESGRVAIAGARYTRRAGVSGRRERTTRQQRPPQGKDRRGSDVIGRWGRLSHFSNGTRGHGHAGSLFAWRRQPIFRPSRRILEFYGKVFARRARPLGALGGQNAPPAD